MTVQRVSAHALLDPPTVVRSPAISARISFGLIPLLGAGMGEVSRVNEFTLEFGLHDIASAFPETSLFTPKHSFARRLTTVLALH